MKKYQHIERDFTSRELDGLLDGKLIIQPKLDGSNCQIYMEAGDIIITSRNRVLSNLSDNAGCYAKLIKEDKYERFFNKYPDLKLVGEWLIPHKIQYDPLAYNELYIFDAIIKDTEDDNGNCEYVYYPLLVRCLFDFGISAVPYNITSKLEYDFNSILARYLLLDNAIGGEGVVIKNYEYKNPFGKSVWGKIINHDAFKLKEHIKGEPLDNMIELAYVADNITDHLLDKCYHRINDNTTFTSKQIGQYVKDCQNEFYEDYWLNSPAGLNIKWVNTCVARLAVQFLKDSKYI